MLPYARLREPTRGADRERSSSHPTPSSISATTSRSSSVSPQPPNGVPRSRTSSRDGALGRGSDLLAPQSRTNPTPLVIPARSESLPGTPPAHTTDAMSQNATKPLRFAPKRHSSSPSPLNNNPPTINLSAPILHASTATSLNGTTSHSSQALEPRPQSAGSNADPNVNLTPNYLSSPTGRKPSRESGISLPDEARQFIVNMADSPLHSPQSTSDKIWGAQKDQNGDRTLAHVPEEGERSTDASPKPFLDLGDDSDTEQRESEDNNNRNTLESDSEEVDPERGFDGEAGFGHSGRRGDLSRNGQTPKTRVAGDTMDQFPLPPATLATGAGRPPSSPTKLHGGSATTNSSVAGPSTSSSLSVHSTNTANGSDSKRSRDQNRDSFIMPTNAPAATFRQMPLLNSDLKTTTANVIGSQIRANDKGKDVLSFVIAVNVVGKEGWTVCHFPF